MSDPNEQAVEYSLTEHEAGLAEDLFTGLKRFPSAKQEKRTPPSISDEQWQRMMLCWSNK